MGHLKALLNFLVLGGANTTPKSCWPLCSGKQLYMRSVVMLSQEVTSVPLTFNPFSRTSHMVPPKKTIDYKPIIYVEDGHCHHSITLYKKDWKIASHLPSLSIATLSYKQGFFGYTWS